MDALVLKDADKLIAAHRRMRERFEREALPAFRQIDKANERTRSGGGSRKYDFKAAETIHDVAQRNPMVAKLLRELQKAGVM